MFCRFCMSLKDLLHVLRIDVNVENCYHFLEINEMISNQQQEIKRKHIYENINIAFTSITVKK